MPSDHDTNEDLQDVDDVVPSLHVCPLVNQDAIQFVGIELRHQRRRVLAANDGNRDRPAQGVMPR